MLRTIIIDMAAVSHVNLVLICLVKPSFINIHELVWVVFGATVSSCNPMAAVSHVNIKGLTCPVSTKCNQKSYGYL